MQEFTDIVDKYIFHDLGLLSNTRPGMPTPLQVKVMLTLLQLTVMPTPLMHKLPTLFFSIQT